MEANDTEGQAEEETNGALGAALTVGEDAVAEDDDDIKLIGDVYNTQEDIIREDSSAYSSEWSFNLDNVLDESHSDPITHKTIDDTEVGVDGDHIAETIASSGPRRENVGMGVERLEIEFGGKKYKSAKSHHYMMRKAKHVVLE